MLSDLELADVKIPTQTAWGATHFQQVLQSPTDDVKSLKQRQLALFALRHTEAASCCAAVREKLPATDITKVVDEFETDVDPRIVETIEQIYWSPSSMGGFLNDQPRLIASIVFWKTLVLPTITVMIPLLAIIVPFLIIRFFHGVEVSAADYMAQLRNIMLKQVTIPPVLRAKHAGDVVGHMLETGFLVLSGATYVSGLWSQVTASLHLRTIAIGIRDKGVAIADLLGTFEGILGELNGLPERLQRALRPFLLRGEKILADVAPIPRDCGYRTYGYVWKHRQALVPMKAWLGELDAMLGIVAIPDITFPTYTKAVTLQMEDVYHPGLPDGVARIPNTVVWRPRTHALLTGPNRGGKSTLCRAVGLSILCAQSWGFAFARRMSLTPFAWIETALHPADTLGEMSLFEAEIEFAKAVLEHGRSGKPMFVMMDEIFHSTNARDGLAASRVFLSQLFAISNITSLISTHYKELPAEFGSQALAWAMDATETPEGFLRYSYKMVEGVSDKSSVMEILRERGLSPV